LETIIYHHGNGGRRDWDCRIGPSVWESDQFSPEKNQPFLVIVKKSPFSPASFPPVFVTPPFFHWLVVYLPTPLKNDGASWDGYSLPYCFWKVIQNSMVPVSTKQI